MKTNRLICLSVAMATCMAASCSMQKQMPCLKDVAKEEIISPDTISTPGQRYIDPRTLLISAITIDSAGNYDATWYETGVDRARSIAKCLVAIHSYRLIKDGPNVINSTAGPFLINWNDTTNTWKITHYKGRLRYSRDITHRTRIIIVTRKRAGDKEPPQPKNASPFVPALPEQTHPTPTTALTRSREFFIAWN